MKINKKEYDTEEEVYCVQNEVKNEKSKNVNDKSCVQNEVKNEKKDE